MRPRRGTGRSAWIGAAVVTGLLLAGLLSVLFHRPGALLDLMQALDFTLS